MCQGRGEVQSVQRSFLGQVMTAAPVPAVPGLRHAHPAPVPRVLGRGPRPDPSHAHREGPAGRRHRHAHPAHRRGRGRPRRRSRRRPVPRDRRDARTTSSPARATTCTARSRCPMTAAALGTSIDLETLDGPEDIDVRPGTQSGQSVTAARRGVAHLRASGRGDLHVHVDVVTPTKLDARAGGAAPRAGRACATRSASRAPSRAATSRRAAACSPGSATRSTPRPSR